MSSISQGSSSQPYKPIISNDKASTNRSEEHRIQLEQFALEIDELIKSHTEFEQANQLKFEPTEQIFKTYHAPDPFDPEVFKDQDDINFLDDFADKEPPTSNKSQPAAKSEADAPKASKDLTDPQVESPPIKPETPKIRDISKLSKSEKAYLQELAKPLPKQTSPEKQSIAKIHDILRLDEINKFFKNEDYIDIRNARNELEGFIRDSDTTRLDYLLTHEDFTHVFTDSEKTSLKTVKSGFKESERIAAKSKVAMDDFVDFVKFKFQNKPDQQSQNELTSFISWVEANKPNDFDGLKKLKEMNSDFFRLIDNLKDEFNNPFVVKFTQVNPESSISAFDTEPLFKTIERFLNRDFNSTMHYEQLFSICLSDNKLDQETKEFISTLIGKKSKQDVINLFVSLAKNELTKNPNNEELKNNIISVMKKTKGITDPVLEKIFNEKNEKMVSDLGSRLRSLSEPTAAQSEIETEEVRKRSLSASNALKEQPKINETRARSLSNMSVKNITNTVAGIFSNFRRPTLSFQKIKAFHIKKGNEQTQQSKNI
jgi:hypothetical protein